MNSNDGDDLIDLALRVGDRVERLDLAGNARWGTITAADADDGWLILDNAGNTRRDSVANLRRATRATASPFLPRRPRNPRGPITVV